VERTHVRFNNRYGIAIAADIYTPKALDESRKYPALIVGAPYGGVKEQGANIATPRIGQTVSYDDISSFTEHWWEEYK
jgi:fermentation-respiration switch protein FrsA (DUF1100 family)